MKRPSIKIRSSVWWEAAQLNNIIGANAPMARDIDIMSYFSIQSIDRVQYRISFTIGGLVNENLRCE